MNSGRVLCFDKSTETFLKDKQGNYSIARINKFSLVDLKMGYCLSVSEKG
jgi:hypothetical protein